MVAAALEDVEETDKVAVEIGIGVGDAVADSRLGSEIDDLVEMLVGKEAVKALTVGEVHADKTEVTAELVKTALLETDVVIVIDVVDSDDLVAALCQQIGKLRADESGCSCY